MGVTHRFEYRRMLAHAEIIVRTPDGHLILQAVVKGLRKVTGAPFEVGKDPISVFTSYELETGSKSSSKFMVPSLAFRKGEIE
jgi:hypothetical protein